MRVFVSGASGLVGGNCLKYFNTQGWVVAGSHLSYATDHTVYYDTLVPEHPDNFDILGFKPDVIVHCGALTHVDYCEDHLAESYDKTVQSTKNLIAKAAESKAKIVLLSTDYVFDGANGPYREDAGTNPLSIYGQHKLHAEQAVQASGLPHLILRVTNVYGEELRRKNFVARIVDQCLEGKELLLKLPIDQYANPTNAKDIAGAMHLLLRDGREGIYHIGGTDYMNRVELCLKIIAAFPQASYQLNALPTAALGQAAARPLFGGFVKEKFSTQYPEYIFSTIDNYLAEIKGTKK